MQLMKEEGGGASPVHLVGVSILLWEPNGKGVEFQNNRTSTTTSAEERMMSM